MPSRTSFFNKTVFKKNLTRFAPAWGLYTLCLILGVVLIYHNGGSTKAFHFGSNLTELIQIMSIVNLIYAPLVAQLLFGDLYSSRMCNALHAMPIRRDCWLATNVLSGLTFSLVPTAIMALVCLPLLSNSYFAHAWQIPLFVFAGINLEFICFFGMAVFCALCVGNRLSMAVVYGLLNFGAFIAYWLINTIYTPMLYGVVTPTRLVESLTPVAQFMDHPFLETDTLYQLREVFGENLKNAVAHFTLTENWSYLFIWAAVGTAFLALALVLYRKRNLECAGDAMAFKLLEPVFQILCAVVTAAAAQFFISDFLGFYGEYHYMFLITGLVIGWFACRMLIERATRVFRLRNWYGLAGLLASLAMSLFLTHVDILGIETWVPKLDDVTSVAFSYSDCQLTDKADIQKILNLQTEALDTRLEESGAYIQDENGQWISFRGVETPEELEEMDDIDSRYAYYARITYTLKNGREVTRNYPIWFDGQAGDDVREILSRWEYVKNDSQTVYINGKEITISVLDTILDAPEALYVEGIDNSIETIDRAMAQELLAAVQADCNAGSMAQARYLQRGHFRKDDPEKEGHYYYRPSLYISLDSKDYGWGVDVYPECENTLNWLRKYDLLTYDIWENTLCFY